MCLQAAVFRSCASKAREGQADAGSAPPTLPLGRPITTALAARLYLRSASRPIHSCALAPPAAGGGEPAVGIGGDLDELLERRLEARIAAAAQDDLLGEEEREVTQLERWVVGNRPVPSPAGDASSVLTSAPTPPVSRGRRGAGRSRGRGRDRAPPARERSRRPGLRHAPAAIGPGASPAPREHGTSDQTKLLGDCQRRPSSSRPLNVKSPAVQGRERQDQKTVR
jgi:hypothetical protein